MMLPPLWLLACFVLKSQAIFTTAINNKTFEYIVVGSGPGGSPIASNLARAGHSVLLIEAGDDQTENTNVSQWLNFNAAGNDPATRWDFFVRHSDDDEREARYLHRTWRKEDGGFYVGVEPPKGAKAEGIYYPRAGTLGGCAMHNGCLTMNPNDVDWDDIANLTGDKSWSHENMRKYLVRLEKTHYNSTSEHGHSGWLDMTMLDPGYSTSADSRQLSELATQAAGYNSSTTAELLQRDMNGNQIDRDQLLGPFGGVSHINPNGRRSSPGYYARDTANDDRYPLTISLDTLATKLILDKNDTKPKAVGIEYLQGRSLYSADPRQSRRQPGTPGKVFASKEVIISGGAFNTPQLLMLSGIGPQAHLEKHNISALINSPGVGQHLADNYESSILALGKRPVTGNSEIFPAFWKTSQNRGIRDIYMWCGSFAFEGFWPGFPNRPPYFNETYGPSQYECALVHMNPRSQAGTIELRSNDPRDVPAINFNFFKDSGSEKDIEAILEGIDWVRSWLGQVDRNVEASLAPFKELHPCEGTIGIQNCTRASQMTYIKEQAYSHHASSSARIGADEDEMAVLDSKFRVRGVERLRVVDASAFPKVPGAFPILPTFMISEKATDDVLADAARL